MTALPNTTTLDIPSRGLPAQGLLNTDTGSPNVNTTTLDVPSRGGPSIWLRGLNTASSTLTSVALNTGTAFPASASARVNFVGIGTTWLSVGPTITPDAGSLGAITVDSDTTAHATFTAPGSAQTVTFTASGPDTGTAGLTVVAVSTGYSLSGPSSGVVNVASTAFTATLTPAGSAVAADVTVTPAISPDGSTGGGSVVLVAFTASASDTFTVTPTATGAHSVSTTDNGGLTDPSPTTYTATVFDPSNVATLAGWYKADAGVYSDAGVTPAVDGGTWQQVNDQSGNGWHLSQATAGSRATYQAPVHGDIGALVFTGGKFAENTAFAAVNAATTFTIFSVVEQSTGGILISTNSGGAGFEFFVNDGNAGNTAYFSTRAVFGVANGSPGWIKEWDYDGGQATNALKIAQYDNGVLHASGARPLGFTGTVPTALPSTNGLRVGNSAGTSLSWTGKLRELAIYSGTVTAQNRTDLLAYFRARHALGTRNSLICSGDSLTSGIGGTPYPTQLATSLGTDWLVDNIGIASSQALDWVTYSGQFSYPATGHARDVEVVLLGVNDLINGRTEAQIEASLTSYWAARRSAGRQVFACTIYDVNVSAPIQAIRAAVNAWILTQSSSWDAVVDLAGDARLADHTNTTYFTGGGVHLVTAGYAAVAQLVQNILTPSGRPRRASMGGGFAALTGGI